MFLAINGRFSASSEKNVTSITIARNVLILFSFLFVVAFCILVKFGVPFRRFLPVWNYSSLPVDVSLFYLLCLFVSGAAVRSVPARLSSDSRATTFPTY